MSSARTETALVMPVDGDCALSSAIRIASFHRFVWNIKRTNGTVAADLGMDIDRIEMERNTIDYNSLRSLGHRIVYSLPESSR